MGVVRVWWEGGGAWWRTNKACAPISLRTPGQQGSPLGSPGMPAMRSGLRAPRSTYALAAGGGGKGHTVDLFAARPQLRQRRRCSAYDVRNTKFCGYGVQKHRRCVKNS